MGSHMSGLVRIRWTADGEIIKDDTTPHSFAEIQTMSDGMTVEILGEKVRLDFTIDFDPPLVCPKAEAP